MRLLWPYLSHPTSSVRRSALQTLQTLTKCASTVFADFFYGIEHKNPIDSNNPVNPDKEVQIKAEDTQIDKNKMCNLQEAMNALGIESDDVDSFDGDKYLWDAQLLQDTLRHLFQRVLVEHLQDIKNMIEAVSIL